MEAYALGASAGFAGGKALNCFGTIFNKVSEHYKRFSCLLLVKGVSYVCDKYADSRKYFIDVDQMLQNIPNYELRLSSATEKIMLFDELNDTLIKLRNQLKKKIIVCSRDYNLLKQLHTRPCKYLCPTESLMNKQMAGMYTDE